MYIPLSFRPNYQYYSVVKYSKVGFFSDRPPDKSAYWKIIFFISHAKHMLWVLKRTISMRRLFRVPKTHVRIIG